MADNEELIASSVYLGTPYQVTDTGCWIWDGHLNDQGYGCVQWDGKWQKVHRLAYQTLIGDCPDGLEPDHTCHTNDPSCQGGPTCIHRRCFNPHHLEWVTHAENVRRGLAGKVNNFHAAKTKCDNGHDLEGYNLRMRRDGRGRTCKICVRDAMRRFRERKRVFPSVNG